MKNWLWILGGVYVVGLAAIVFMGGGLQPLWPWLFIKKKLGIGRPGQSSGTTDFYALGKKPVKAADDITLGTPNSQGTTDGGKTWGNAAIGETVTS